MPRKEEVQELPAMEGPGVERLKIKELDRLGDKFNDLLEERSELTGEIKKVENKMAEVMAEKGISKYHWSDKVMEIKIGATHIKVKVVKNEGVEANGSEE